MRTLELNIGGSLRSPIGDVQYVGSRVEDDRLIVQLLRAGRYEDHEAQDAFRLLADCAVEVEPLDPGPDAEHFASLKESTRSTALMKERHVNDVLVGLAPGPKVDSRYVQTTTSRAQRLQAKAAEIGVNVSTVRRWCRAYEANEVKGLVHQNAGPKRHVEDSVPASVLEVVKIHVAREATASKKTFRVEYAMVMHALENAGLASPVDRLDANGDLLPRSEELLPEKTFKKLLAHLRGGASPKQTAQTRQSEGKRAVSHGPGHNAFDFGAVVMMDSTKCDFLVKGPQGDFRPWAVFAVDVSTKYLWLRLTPTAPTGVDLGLLLSDMITSRPFGAHGKHSPIPTVPRAVGINGEPGPMTPATLPGVVMLDHGAEEENWHFISLLMVLGVSIEWARAMSPADKAPVESAIRGFARMTELVPGHIGNNVVNRPESDPSKALWTYAQAARMFTAFPDWYSAQPHTGLPHALHAGRVLTPLEAVHTSLAYGTPLRISANNHLNSQFLPRRQLTPREFGVRYRGLTYRCDEENLNLMLRTSSRQGPRKSLLFHHDPNDPRWLLWNKPGTYEQVVLRCHGGTGNPAPAFPDIVEERLGDVAGHKPLTSKKKAVAYRALLEGFEDIANDDLYKALEPVPAATRARERRPPAFADNNTNGLDADMFTDLDMSPADFDEEDPE